MFVSKIASAVVVALLASMAVGQKGCTSLPARTGVGRGSGPYDSKSHWCPSQIKVCDQICKGKTATNECTLNSPTSACYTCTCATEDGTGSYTPDLAPYEGTIPTLSCEQLRFNCNTSPWGGFPGQCDSFDVCGKLSLDAPLPPVTIAPEPSTTTPAFVPTTQVEAPIEVVESPVPVLAETTSSALPLSTSTSSVLSTSSAGTVSSTTLSTTTSSLVQTTSIPVSNSTLAEVTTSSTSTRSRTTRTSSATSTPTALRESGGVSVKMGGAWVSGLVAGVVGFGFAMGF